MPLVPGGVGFKGYAVLGVGLLALLCSLIPHRKCGYLFTANRAVARQDLECLRTALENYALEHEGGYPSDLGGLPDRGDGSVGYLGGRTTLCSDPWRHPYLYELCAQGRGFRLASLGQDGLPGGDGEAADLVLVSR